MHKQKTHLTVQGDTIYVVSPHDITEDDAFKDIVGNKHAQAGFSEQKNIYHVSVPAKPMFAFMLRHTLKFYDVSISAENALFLKTEADRIPRAQAKLSEDQKRLEIIVPMIKHYRDLLYKVDAYPKTQGNYTVPVARAIELFTAVEMDDSKYPPLVFSQDAMKLFKEPIPGFDGSVDSLKTIPLNVLNVITADTQSRKQRKASNKPLDEKFAEHGIENLYQLLFEIPRRYIDKSNPQKVHELEVGQEATIIGTVAESETFNSGRGLNLDVEILGIGGRTKNVRVSFFAGAWMQPKFKVGSEVVVTGKYKPWRGQPQITGSTIEFVDSASALPITPIYSQSEKKGITTVVVMRVIQELIARLGDVELPFYLRTLETSAVSENKHSTYTDLIRAVHFPESMAQRENAIKQLAFYELVEMQVVVQSRRHEVNVKRAHTGLSHKRYEDKAFASAVKNLPFQLTGSQKKGLHKISQGMEEPASWQGLLSADVGAGKSIIAILSALIAIDSGYQAAILAPTEILARQLFEGFTRTRESIEEPWKQNVNIIFYTGSMKAKEKREILAKIKSGEANVVVSTQAAMTGAMEFRDLGFVAIDEQQKFGAEQRSALLRSRVDGRIPDILQMTATPIPRSVSQVFYGDMDFIALEDKPAGRLPIITEWIEETPRTVVTTHVHRIWDDVKKEIAQGRKAFVIAPLVEDSESIDASSVEATYRHLSAGALTGVNIGFVHGKMKAEEARQKMLDFKNGVYDVLVASTIIEVGVDVPEATRMVILSAERLGASSLHQIRGRVGRNSLQSKCYLVAADITDNGQTRLQALVDSNSGFEIAKNDLLVRSEGSLFGTSQSGKSEFQFLKLASHGRWITHATEAAQSILAEPFGQAAVEVCKEKFGAASSRVL